MSQSACKQLTRELRANRDINPPSLADTRSNFAELTAQFPVDPRITVTETTMGGVPAERLDTPAVGSRRILLYFHGGGYIIGSPRTHRALAGALALESGAHAIVPDYRLAPENPHPAAIEDAFSVYSALLEQGEDHRNVMIGGDSAGGGLTVALLTLLRDRNLPLPAAALCISPWTDLEATGDSVTRCADSDPIVAPNHIHAFAHMFIGSGDLRDPLASPLHANLVGLPPMLVQVGDNETLMDDATRLAERAEQAGVDVSLRVWPGMFHVWHLYASQLDEGRAAIEEAGQFMARRWQESNVASAPGL